MRCHYEVLCVDRNVTDEELKKSYRQLALQSHPDKNPNNADEAKVKFQEIQGAYEILSDPQERAFYDRNRESILRGGPDSTESPKTADINLYQYFNSSCFSGYDDSPKGFYTVFREVFDLITSKDLAYFENSISANIPSFGNSEASLEDVGVFYGYWQSYRTSISFTWVEIYNISQAHNRYAEKCIEKENKKVRDEAKREFNEEVRSLVEFVRKRDKRWQARKEMLEDRVKENREKQVKKQEKKREERAKWMEEVKEEQSENMKEYEKHLKAMESQFAAEWGISDDDESSSNDDEISEQLMRNLYCIACDKMFKSVKSFGNHEGSRKHKENALILKQEMREEEGLSPDDGSPIDEILEEEPMSKKKKKKKKNQAKFAAPQESPEDANVGRKKLSKKKRQDFVFNIEEKEKSEESSDNEEENKPIEDVCRENGTTDDVVNGISDGDEHNDIINEKDDIKDDVKENVIEDIKDNEKDDSDSDSVEYVIVGKVDENISVGPKSKNKEKELPPKSKAKAKQARKKSQKMNEKASTTVATSAKCSVCSKEFASRSKLFSHIKAEGHAALKDSQPLVSKSKKKR